MTPQREMAGTHSNYLLFSELCAPMSTERSSTSTTVTCTLVQYQSNQLYTILIKKPHIHQLASHVRCSNILIRQNLDPLVSKWPSSSDQISNENASEHRNG